jgi:hypothetical protein
MDHLLPSRLDQDLATIQKEVQPWTLPEKAKRCEYAQRFSDWVEDNLGANALGNDISLLTILLAKAKVTDRYRYFRRQANSRCREHTSKRGHVCIFHVWDEAYSCLEELEGRLPEPLSIPELQQIQLLKEQERNTPFATLVALQSEERK